MKVITPAVVICAAGLVWGCSDEGTTRPIPPGHPSISAVFEQECSRCHQLQRVNQVSGASLSEVSELVQRMIGHGADLQGCNEEEFCRYVYKKLQGDDETIGDW